MKHRGRTARRPLSSLLTAIVAATMACASRPASPSVASATHWPPPSATPYVAKPSATGLSDTVAPSPARTAAPPLETDPAPTATPDCRDPDGLLTLVDQDHPLQERYVPADLQELTLPPQNTLRAGLKARAVIVAPLIDLLNDMNKAGVGPSVVSAYRSYSEQRYTYEVALTEQPGRADQISARPGFSEHQLGTAVDFGAWSLGNQFHTDFYTTPEGQWLAENSVRFGFVLSYPGWGEKVTGYFFEPWHFRYVGVKLARELGRRGITLIEYLREREKRGCEVTANR